MVGKNTILYPTFWIHGQFGSCYFQLITNLVPTVNLLTANAYVTNGVHCWHT